jgi:hypothetical protein
VGIHRSGSCSLGRTRVAGKRRRAPRSLRVPYARAPHHAWPPYGPRPQIDAGSTAERIAMPDLIYLTLGVALFVLSGVGVRLCERL